MRKLTKYEYKNEYLEENIKKIWELVLDCPPFDNDYILYRFVSNDDYLSDLKIGDIYEEPGFTSTTRDPFYKSDTYQFGNILIKIRIPKNTRGVGLALETLSHFPAEEEIILPPFTQLKLISKDDSFVYYHPDEEFVSQIKKKYEFEWIGHKAIKFPTRIAFQEETKVIDFLTLEKTKTVSLKEKIDIVIRKHFDPMNRIKCKIGETTFYVVAEWYDSTSAYNDMYALKTSDGFSLYSIYNNYILFMIEMGEVDGFTQLRVNYYTKYSELNREEIMGDDNFIQFISSIAVYFDIPNVIIYSDYISCDKIYNHTKKMSRHVSEKNIKNTKTIDDSIKDIIKVLDSVKLMKHTKTYNKTHNKIKKNRLGVDKNNKNYDNDTHDELVDDTRVSGGSYCVDFYRYLKYETKRYEDTNILNVELQPKFSYHDLDKFKTLSPLEVLNEFDRDEVYQIYKKNYKLDTDTKKDNIADFYIWMIENKCYLMDIFIKKIDRLYKKYRDINNPFKNDMYILDAMSYLYNRRLTSVYNRYIKMEFSEERQILTLPKNDYRIRR